MMVSGDLNSLLVDQPHVLDLHTLALTLDDAVPPIGCCPQFRPTPKAAQVHAAADGVVKDVSAAAVDAETGQLPEDEGPMVVPIQGVGEGAQVAGAGGYVVDDGLQLTADLEPPSWRYQLLIWMCA
jgi:hypothetical protein